jgi:predicted 3-demethylubiquinone-9 3-methyltransferase (glyoxalase superfamily)
VTKKVIEDSSMKCLNHCITIYSKTMLQKITPFLWFNDQAEEAANFYISIFKNAKILHVTPGQNGKASWVSFVLDGQTFHALNGGPLFKFTEAISFFVSCEDQKEVDYFWSKLTSDGGVESQCGWLKDKYGLSWQIVPRALGEYLGKDKSGKVMQAMLTMKKIDIAGLKSAYEEK